MNDFISELFLSAHKTTFNFHDLVLISATLVAVLLASLIRNSDSGEKHRLLVAFFIALGLGQLNFLLTYNIPIHILLRAPFGGEFFNWSALPYFLQGPLLLGYIAGIAKRPLPLNRLHAAVITSFLTLWFIDPVTRFGGAWEFIFWRDYVLTGTLAFTLSIGFALFGLRLIHQQQETIASQLDSSSPVSLGWLKTLVICLTGLWCLEAMAPFIYGHTPFLFEQFAIYSKNAATLLLLIWLFRHWRSPQRVTVIDPTLDSPQSPPAPDISELAGLQDAMRESALYRNHDLTIQDFSDYVKMPARTVSQWINNGLNKNFYEFVNDFRLHQARSLLADAAYQDKSIQWIYLDVGFRSKSSFNTLFKKQFGMTPSSYRQEYQKDGLPEKTH